jgi:GNAT superfamily N-acetyltransferase
MTKKRPDQQEHSYNLRINNDIRIERKTIMSNGHYNSYHYYAKNRGKDIGILSTSHYLFTNHGTIESIRVNSPYRRKGIAKSLMKKALNDHYHFKTKYISLVACPYYDDEGPDIECLITFYKSFGFDIELKGWTTCSMIKRLI